MPLSAFYIVFTIFTSPAIAGNNSSRVHQTLAEAGISMARAAEDARDWAKAVELYANACEQDDAIYCSKAARIASEKLHKQELAQQYYHRGCERGDSIGCYDYGVALEKAGSFEKSRHFYETFCEKNKTPDSAIFCLRAGTMAAEKGDHETAKFFLRTACDKHEPTGCFGLGLALRSEGAEKEARRYLASSCKSGLKDACAYLK